MEMALTLTGGLVLVIAFSLLVDHLFPGDRGPSRVNGTTRHDPDDHFGGTFPDHP